METKDSENINSDLIIKKKDSKNSQFDEEKIEILNFQENHFKEMEEEINKLKEFHINEIQLFESNYYIYQYFIFRFS